LGRTEGRDEMTQT